MPTSLLGTFATKAENDTVADYYTAQGIAAHVAEPSPPLADDEPKRHMTDVDLLAYDDLHDEYTQPRTQKARGVQYLHAHGYDTPATTFWFGDERPEHLSYPAFARPCPVTPRHGFVDSRIVRSHAEAEAVLAEARAADPQAELMIARPINADASAVLTPRAAAIGPGHDGATSGKPGVITIGLTYTDLPAPADLVPEGQVPYIELVRDPNYGVLYTQLRSGPALSAASGDWVPADTAVAAVLDAHSMSPLELEDALEHSAEGTVVWQANGSPCSHAACHARLNGRPIVFGTQAPAIGSRLSKTADADVLMAQTFARAVRYYGAAEGLSRYGSTSTVWAIHQAIDLCASDAGAQYVAKAAVEIWRYAASACIAEARHSEHDERGRRRRRKPSRSTCYGRTLGLPASHVTLRKRTAVSLVLFDEGEWAGGYGGQSWRNCARAAFRLYDALAAVSVKGGATEDNVRAVIAAAHGVVNAAHNNGPFLDKFFPAETFDRAADGATSYTVRGIFDVYNEARSVAMVDAPALPLRRKHAKKAAPVPSLADIQELMQWNLRSDGLALHVQYGVRGNYHSATLPLAVLNHMTRAVLRTCADSIPATLPSLAGSPALYWPAIGAAFSAETVRALFPNLRFAE